jgi:predicted HD phosphohydrolase
MQGGPLNQEEVMDFISREGAEDAVQLRLWDDAAKVRGKPTSSLRDFENLINSLAISK